MKDAKLNIKEQRFCNAYVKNGGHGTNAVISAGYSENGSSVQASRMLAKPTIQGEIRRQEEFAVQSSAISKEQIVQEQYQLYQLARADERYKDASSILAELSNLLGYKPKLNEPKRVLHSHSFEQILKDEAKDITPEKRMITVN